MIVRLLLLAVVAAVVVVVVVVVLAQQPQSCHRSSPPRLAVHSYSTPQKTSLAQTFVANDDVSSLSRKIRPSLTEKENRPLKHCRYSAAPSTMPFPWFRKKQR